MKGAVNTLKGLYIPAAIGLAWVAGSHQLEYLRPAREGEALVLHTWVEGLAGSQSRRYPPCQRQSAYAV